jgi:N-acetylmuramic acid 6-phosphate etherase
MSEEVHPRADELDALSTLELLEVMHAEDRRAIEAVRARLPMIAGAIDQIVDRLRSGGHLHYFGAGTSGRLAALDAAECSATFGIDPALVQAHSAGDGEEEDDRRGGWDAARGSRLGPGDAAIGISAGGRTAFVLAAIEHARAAGALVITLTCAPSSPLGAAGDIAIEVETGPEVIAGSTRLKAGTVQKVVLNLISTGVFTRLGHTYRGRMVDVLASNDKLRGRAERMVKELADVPAVEAAQALAEADGNPKVAILMLRQRVTAHEARLRLAAARGDLSSLLTQVRP